MATESHPSPTKVRGTRMPRVAPRAARIEPEDNVYRVVWRWHFYAGLIVAPVLIVMAATGATYIFKDELEQMIYARMLLVTPEGARASYDAQLAAAIDGAPPGLEIRQLYVPAEPSRATVVVAEREDEFHELFVDPYRCTLLGEMGPGNFFDVVLKIHRTMFVGTAGRIITELVTCWTIVLVVTGLYLWWPRGRKQVWGAWLPRLRRHPYTTLRDLHALGGAYLAAIVLVIACTGLLYTYVWGSGYALAAVTSGAYDVFLHPPKSNSAAEAESLSLDEVVAIASEKLPGSTLSVTIPRERGLAFVVFGSSPVGPSSDGVVVIDHASGEVLSHRTTSEYPALGWWTCWNYPLHVGSILGLPTKILWLLACFVLMLLPVTGIWMWWRRRPAGRTGFPRRTQARVSKGVWALIAALAVVLPMLGASLVLILLGEFAVGRLRLAQGRSA